MDATRKVFDQWAQDGRAENMEKEHSKNVIKFLTTVSFEKPFTFLDVGCGNGWVVRKMIEQNNCRRATGIDKSKNMIKQANRKKISKKENYIHVDIESWKHKGKFDFIFAMESLYYVESVENSLRRIFEMLKPNGKFFCGTDFYSENKDTVIWSEIMKIKMHLYSRKEWRELFKNVGFEVKTRQIKDRYGNKKWKREVGTLFIIGHKPER